MGREWRFETSLSASDVIRAIRERVDPVPAFSFLRVPGDRPFLGEVWTDAFEIRRREFIGKNDFGAVLRATVQSSRSGAEITGIVGARPILKAFFWIFAVLGVFLAISGAIVAIASSGTGRFVLLYVGLAFLVLGPGVCALFLLPSWWDRRRLINDVEQALSEESR